MDVLTTYTGVTAVWLAVQAVTLFAFPRLILDLLAARPPPAAAGLAAAAADLGTETYLARLLAVALFTLTIVALYFTYVPPPPPYTSVDTATAAGAGSSNASSAITHILTLFHVLSFIVIYTRYAYLSSVLPPAPLGSGLDHYNAYAPNTAGYILGASGYAVCASIGIWVLVFGSAPARRSKRTGADKRTSGWPFANDKAYDKKKDKRQSTTT